MTQQYFAIGTTYGGLTNVESLTTKAPLMAPKPMYMAYSTSVQLGNGGRRGLGLPVIIWDFGYIYTDMLTALRVICPGAYADVYIRSRLESGNPTSSAAYTYYQATMIWPELDSYQYVGGKGIYQPFQLRFENCVVYTP